MEICALPLIPHSNRTVITLENRRTHLDEINPSIHIFMPSFIHFGHLTELRVYRKAFAHLGRSAGESHTERERNHMWKNRTRPERIITSTLLLLCVKKKRFAFRAHFQDSQWQELQRKCHRGALRSSPSLPMRCALSVACFFSPCLSVLHWMLSYPPICNFFFLMR